MRWALVALCACSLTEPPPTIVVDTLHTRAVAPEGDAPAFTLTASDGSGLRLVRVQARAVIEGPLAFTELHLQFENPENRVREGTFAITLPARAAISRFGMAEGDKMKEAEVVPKALARRA